MALPKSTSPLDVLQQMFDDVLVQTGKALKASTKDSRGQLSAVTTGVGAQIPASADKFGSALDELESQILRAKSVLLRDLEQLRARRIPPPAPTPAPEPVAAAAPPAPVAADLEAAPLLPSADTARPAGALNLPAAAKTPEPVFTESTFSLAPSTAEPAAPPAAAAAAVDLDLGDFGGADMLDLEHFGADADGGDLSIDLTGAGGGGGGMDASNLDAEIDTLFDTTGAGGADKMEIDYELGGIGLEGNNSFDDMFIESGDDNVGEFNDTYFGL